MFFNMLLGILRGLLTMLSIEEEVLHRDTSG